MTRTGIPRRRQTAIALGAAALALSGTGCGAVKQSQNDNLVAGKQLFVAKCSSCHSLARANAKGVVGPNLDDAFGPSLAAGLKRNTVRGAVRDQILFPPRGSVMPAKLVTGSAAENVAAYVAYAAARPGEDSGLLASAVSSGPGKPAVEANGQLQIDADPTGQLKYVASQASAKPGSVTVVMKNSSGVQHNIAIETGSGGASPSGAVVGASPIVATGTAKVSVTLKRGNYTFFCQVDGHRAAGMYGALVVK
jgi:mono/diheme cytochrome c family protein